MTEQELILTHVRNCRRVDLYSDPRPLTFEQQFEFENILAQRRAGKPLQYLLGECEFMGLKFQVNPSVLVPRPETELLIELAIEKLSSLIKQDREISILDIGTGSGNIAVSLAKLIPNAQVTAIDCSREALKVAQRNADINEVVHKIKFIPADMFSYLARHPDERSEEGSRDPSIRLSIEDSVLDEAGIVPIGTPSSRAQDDTKVDLIISNPPYISSLEIDGLPVDVRQEPRLALDGGEDGLKFYRHIIANGSAHLSEGGLLMMEIGDGQRPALEAILQNSGFRFEFHKDYRETDRILAAIRI